MINYKLHENNWTIFIEDLDMRTASQEDINQIARLIATNTLVIIRNQNLTATDEVRILRMFKNPQTFAVPIATNYVSDLAGAVVEGSEDLFLRVSGKPDDHGRVGIAAYESEMVWHCNDPGEASRLPMVWLYGVEGTVGSRTSYNNNILSYADLSEDMKKEIDNYHLEVIKEMGLDIDNLRTDGVIAEYKPKLVVTNIANKTGLFFPMYHAVKIQEASDERSKEILEFLCEHTVQEQYVYHHDWKDGDIVIGEQNLGIHKRWPFKQIGKRTLHRAAFDFPDQDYSKL
jgi:alpha-ketoglutarate-dependent taurine dioxygenase